MRIPRALKEGVRRSDVVLTGAFLAFSIGQVLWVQPLTYDPRVDVLLATAWVLPMLWRRAHPIAAAVATTAAFWVPVEAFLYLGFVIMILLFYSVGRWANGLFMGVCTCVFALVTGTVGTLLGPEDPVPGVLSTWLVVLAPYGFGLLMRAQHQEAEARLVEEREATRRRAVEEERARIVRELHDVVGHEVTLMSIQSEAAAQALAHAPHRAAEPIQAVRETAHRANRELRAILELLGDGELAVAADAKGLAELTSRAARLGIPSDLRVTGEPWSDAPRHWLAVNRIVQECLTNAGKHAPGEPVVLEVAWGDDAVLLRAANRAPAPPAGGHGLGVPGMAERARLLGGTLEASYDDGCFTVTASLPAPSGERV